MADEKPLPAEAPAPLPPIPAQAAVPRDPRHRVAPAGPRAPFLPHDHVPARHHLKPGD